MKAINLGESNSEMVKLNIDQQLDEIRDIETFIRGLEPIALVELQTQQVRRLIYFAKKGIEAYRLRRAQYNNAYNQPVETQPNDGIYLNDEKEEVS